MDCTVEADGLLTMDVSSCGCKAQFLMSRCEGMMDKPTLRNSLLAASSFILWCRDACILELRNCSSASSPPARPILGVRTEQFGV